MNRSIGPQLQKVGYIVVLISVLCWSEEVVNKQEKSKQDKSGPVIVRVGPFSITEADYKAYLQFRKFEVLSYPPTFSSRLLDSLKGRALDEIVFQHLILILALRENISCEDEEVQKIIEEGIKKLGGKEAYEKWLETSSISESDLRDLVSKEVIIDKYIQKIKGNISISEDRIKAVYENLSKKGVTRRSTETYDFANIFLPDPVSSPKMEKQIKDVYLRIQKGEDFFELAKEYSQDEISTRQGYAYYEVTLKDVSPEVRHYLILLPVGSVSPPFRSRDGWNIIKVLGKYQRGTTIPYDKMRFGLEKQIIESELKSILKDKTERLKNEVEIVYKNTQF